MVVDIYYYVMDKTQLVALITSRSHKLKAYREQAANGNQQKKRLYMASLTYLLEQKRTQSAAYQQLTELLITASPYIAKQIDNQIIPSVIRYHSQSSLDDYIILWEKMLDGSSNRQQFPNLQTRFQHLKINNRQKQLDPRMKNYLLEFEKNFNQKNDQRVEFFQDFDDSVMSDSVLNQSQLMNVIYLSIMEVKVARKKLVEEKLSEQALNQQLTKLRHFLSLIVPSYLSQHEKEEFQRERKWARQFLQNIQQYKRRNPSVSLNQTLILPCQQEPLQVVKSNPKPRTFKKQLDRQFFEDSVELRDQRQSKQYRGPKPLQFMGDSPTPIKMIDPRYVEHNVQSHNNSLLIDNGRRNYGHFNSQEEEVGEEEIVVHKIKTQDFKPSKSKQQVQAQDFSVTQNYFNTRVLMSPRAAAQSQTLQGWGSPTKNSRFKLSQFTSQKKVRKESAPRDQLSTAQPHIIQAYLQHFDNMSEYALFRRNCFQSSYILISSPLVTVNCFLSKETKSRIKIDLTFVNNYHLPVEIATTYKVPQCFSIQKKSNIAKRFQLHSNHKHVFCLGAQEFPLQPCLVSLKVKSGDKQELDQIQIPFSLTMLNFLEFECVSQEEWVRDWTALNSKQSQQFFFFAKHIEVDRHVVGEEIDWILKDTFVRVAAVSGYSIQDYGCICFNQGLHNLRFLVHLSVRVDNIVSLQAISCRLVTKDEREYIEYCMNLWMMLLGKVYF